MKVLRAVFVLFASVIGAGLAMVAGATAGEALNQVFGWTGEAGLAGALGGVLALVVFLSALVWLLARLRAQRTVEFLEAERQQIEQRSSDDLLREQDLWLLRLRRHHETIQMHANASLFASLIGIFVALVSLLATLHFVGVLGEPGSDDSGFYAAVSGICAALASFVGATFLEIYRTANRDLRESGAQLHRRNREVAALRLSFQLGDDGQVLRTRWVAVALRLAEEEATEEGDDEAAASPAGGHVAAWEG